MSKEVACKPAATWIYPIVLLALVLVQEPAGISLPALASPPAAPGGLIWFANSCHVDDPRTVSTCNRLGHSFIGFTQGVCKICDLCLLILDALCVRGSIRAHLVKNVQECCFHLGSAVAENGSSCSSLKDGLGMKSKDGLGSEVL